MTRPYPDLLSEDESKALLKRAEQLWNDLQEDRLGGYSGPNRPFWILAEFQSVIEAFGQRDLGRTWTKDQLDAAKPAT